MDRRQEWMKPKMSAPKTDIKSVTQGPSVRGPGGQGPAGQRGGEEEGHRICNIAQGMQWRTGVTQGLQWGRRRRGPAAGRDCFQQLLLN